MSREVKTHVTRSVDPSAQGITASALPTLTHRPALDDPTHRDEDEESQDKELQYSAEIRRSETADTDTSHVDKRTLSSHDSATVSAAVRHRPKPTAKSVDKTLTISRPPPTAVASNNSSTKGTWTQQQQKQLELALSQVPKSCSDRWDRVAELVPDKTKVFDDVLNRAVICHVSFRIYSLLGH